MKQHENLRRCCALSYYSYCLRLAALYLSVLFHYKNGALFHRVRQMKNGRDEAV
ncbi:hypothetical protein HMPREF9120_02019 [Neisseria sp. oral taxon 020 str. F0370]|nr:hypothetical protein HMPREF9120_02019 [Neisseria sp. oral taxon 020 str. F0370]